MLRLSIIIPFYNVEKYIAECLDSVFDQDIPLEEYEVICVNDGSPDHSRDIVLDYMKRYPNLRLVEHDHNRKLGAARNTGRAAAKGTYIWNVDSDDKIAPNCLGEMLKVCEENKLDILRFQARFFCENRIEKEASKIWKEGNVSTGINFWHEQGLSNISQVAAVWVMMIRRDFLNENNIFSPEINMGEDMPYTFKSMLLAQRILTTNCVFYEYRINENSISGVHKKTPSSRTIYEDCILCTGAIYKVSLLTTDKVINSAFHNVIRYLFLLDMKLTQHLNKTQSSELRMLFWRNIFNTCFLFKVLHNRQKLYFVSFLLGGKYSIKS